MITPPVGLNPLTIKAITKAPTREVIVGTAPYVLMTIGGLALLIIWQQIALWPPGTMLDQP